MSDTTKTSEATKSHCISWMKPTSPTVWEGTGDETGLWYGIRSFRVGLTTFYGIASPEDAREIFTESKFPTSGNYPTLKDAKDACEETERSRLEKGLSPEETPGFEAVEKLCEQIRDQIADAVEPLQPAIEKAVEKATEPPPLEWFETTYGEKCVAKSREFEIIRESENSFTLKHRKHSEPKFILIEAIKTATEAKKVAALIEAVGNGIDRFEAANADGIPIIPDIKVSERSDETKPAEPVDETKRPAPLEWSNPDYRLWISSGLNVGYEINGKNGDYKYTLCRLEGEAEERILIGRYKTHAEACRRADDDHAEYVKRQSEPASKYTTVEQTEAAFPGFKNFIQGESAGAKMIIRFADGRKPKYIADADRFEIIIRRHGLSLFRNRFKTGSRVQMVFDRINQQNQRVD